MPSDIKAQFDALPPDRRARALRAIDRINELLDSTGVDALLIAEYCALVREAKIIAEARFS